MILDKDNGKVIDTRDEREVLDLYQSNYGEQLDQNSSRVDKLQWGDFWKNYREIHSRILEAAGMGRVDYIEKIMNEHGKIYPIDLNYRGFDDMTALHYASQDDHAECLKFLLKRGANIEVETKIKRRPIHLAAMRGNVEIISILLQHNCNIDPQDLELNTPLHLTCENNHPKAVVIFLSRKANCSIKNHQNLTAIEMNKSKDIRLIFETFDIKPVNQFGMHRKQYIDKLLSGQNHKRSDSF